MIWKPRKDSVFGVLIRKPWYVSAGIALAIAVLGVIVMPRQYVLVPIAAALPFAVIASIAGWRRAGEPSSAQVERSTAALAALNWGGFADRLEQGFARQGYGIERLAGLPADFALERGGRTTLVGARRWKAVKHGVGPLRELAACRDAREANDAIYVALGEVSDVATKYAAENRIALLRAQELAQMLRGIG